MELPEGKKLAKHQPCGCIVCYCDDDGRCLGCDAKRCPSIINCVLEGNMRGAVLVDD